MSIQLESGRLALRRPELGGFLMVEVREVADHWADSSPCFWADTDTEVHEEHLADDFLPVLRPGDVVPAGSLLYVIPSGDTHTNSIDWPMRDAIGTHLRYALLRFGPEEDA